MGIGDWGLGIGDWGLGIGPNPQSPIPNPHVIIIKKIIYNIILILILYFNNFKYLNYQLYIFFY